MRNQCHAEPERAGSESSCIGVVEGVIDLQISSYTDACLAVLEVAVWVKLVGIHPLERQCGTPSDPIQDSPCPLGDELLNLLVHCFNELCTQWVFCEIRVLLGRLGEVQVMNSRL